ncbi:MAG: hypothetical protein WC810_27520, partial [Janthinobacterium sp.]
MKNILFIIIGLIIGAGLVWGIMFDQRKSENKESLNGPISYNCELSGGKFLNGACVCANVSPQLPIAYDQATGFCQSDAGGPAGNAFYSSIGLPYGDYDYFNSI